MSTTVRERSQDFRPDVASAGMDRPSWAVQCLNCGAALSGDYCSACGQRALPPDPTIRELAGDAFSEFSGWDGKFLKTLKLLVLKPGELTHRFLIGQRIQFISPLRVYLACSFVYFALVALVPDPTISAANGQFTVARGVAVGVSDGATTAPTPTTQAVVGGPKLSKGMAALVVAMNKGLKNLDTAERAAAERQIAKAPFWVRPIVRALAIDQTTLRARISEAMPRALFLLIPGVALTLALFYRRRHYPEHIYFAMHVEAFIFLCFAVSPLAQLTSSVTLMGLVQLAATIGIVAYGLIALRRVYGGTWGETVGKGIGVVAISAIIWLSVVLAVVYGEATHMLARG